MKEAEWSKYGRAAGPMRNKLIIEEADVVVAFPTPSSKGTYNSIKLAHKAGKHVEILTTTGILMEVSNRGPEFKRSGSSR